MEKKKEKKREKKKLWEKIFAGTDDEVNMNHLYEPPISFS